MGPQSVGYHLINVLLHATAAILLWRVLLRLQIPGAWLAAVIFALHPVEVESVAWITEHKNVLSAVFYFAAALACLRFVALKEPGGPNRLRWSWYLGALVLFMAALLSKTVTCSLPAALLLVCWWKKGRIQRGDVMPLLPFFVLGAGLGLMTAWIEKYHVGAQGAAWSLTLGERCLIAGRALWFYAGKLAWPVQLTFIYPRWNLETAGRVAMAVSDCGRRHYGADFGWHAIGLAKGRWWPSCFLRHTRAGAGFCQRVSDAILVCG